MNQYLIYALIILGVFAAGGATGWHERVLREPDMLTAQQTADDKQCANEKQITKEATDALQNDRNQLSARLDALRVQQPTTCIPITGQANLSDRGKRPAGRNGISSDWLLTFAANQCSSYWRQLKICDKFLGDERKINPQP